MKLKPQVMKKSLVSCILSCIYYLLVLQFFQNSFCFMFAHNSDWDISFHFVRLNQSRLLNYCPKLVSDFDIWVHGSRPQAIMITRPHNVIMINYLANSFLFHNKSFGKINTIFVAKFILLALKQRPMKLLFKWDTIKDNDKQSCSNMVPLNPPYRNQKIRIHMESFYSAKKYIYFRNPEKSSLDTL